MLEWTVSIFLILLGIYFLIGFVFAFFFVNKGLQAIDEDAEKTSIYIKLILFPGSIAFWWILWLKWRKIAKMKR